MHNIQRSLSMESVLNSIGIYDNPEGRTIVYEAFYNAYSLLPYSNTLDSGAQEVSNLVWGPGGCAKLQTIWENGKLITIYLFK